MASSNPSNKATATETQIDVDTAVTMDRRRDERREGNPEALDTGVMKSPRRKKQRRRHIDPTTCERDYNQDEIDFMRAMDDYKHNSGRMFPTCSEVLEVLRSMGYVRLTEEQADMFQSDEFDADCDYDASGCEDESEENADALDA
ncbi:hypothetical protein [Stieleria marina]|uniref:Uncharacterized protein n=1 Tax=Stieleria marina TaxID=1930275 RepID=A0A517NPE1_9BACT|nr:hypothetical protein K239x_09380 [Planctomycetes bacterium K23_9]